MPSNWEQATAIQIRQERLDLIQRVLAFQTEFIRNWGREPRLDEVVAALEG